MARFENQNTSRKERKPTNSSKPEGPSKLDKKRGPGNKPSPSVFPIEFADRAPYRMVVLVDGFEFLATIDTGAALTTIRPGVATRTFISERSLRSGKKVQQSAAQILLTIGSRQKLTNCIIVHSQYQALILGRDTIDMFGKMIIIGGVEVQAFEGPLNQTAGFAPNRKIPPHDRHPDVSTDIESEISPDQSKTNESEGLAAGGSDDDMELGVENIEIQSEEETHDFKRSKHQ